MKAVKGNKEYTIDETQKKSYQSMGFDIVDESGNILEYGQGKSVPYGEYIKVLQENQKLHTELDSLRKPVSKNNAEKGQKESEDKAGKTTQKAGE